MGFVALRKFSTMDLAFHLRRNKGNLGAITEYINTIGCESDSGISKNDIAEMIKTTLENINDILDEIASRMKSGCNIH